MRGRGEGRKGGRGREGEGKDGEGREIAPRYFDKFTPIREPVIQWGRGLAD